MSLLAESLVEEWLNRNRFFTIRGVKHGLGELDLLGIRRELNGSIIGWHVEVQTSFRPIGYIAKWPRKMGKPGGYVKRRTPTEIETCAREWVRSKFSANDKAQVRESLWPGIDWSFHLVHAVVHEPQELVIFQQESVTCHPFNQLLEELAHRPEQTYSGSAGGDLAEIVSYYKSEKEKKDHI